MYINLISNNFLLEYKKYFMLTQKFATNLQNYVIITFEKLDNLFPGNITSLMTHSSQLDGCMMQLAVLK